MESREYQSEAVTEIQKDLEAHKRALLCLATGLGKTKVALDVMKTFSSALFVTNKIDLATQSMDRWKQYYGDTENVGLCVGSKGKREVKPYTFATVQTASKLDMSQFELVVLDETHVDLEAETSWYTRLLESCNESKVLGLTATPFRNGKGYIYGKGKFYPRVSYEKGIKWGVEHGFLVEPKLKAGGKSEFDTNKVGIRMGDFDAGQLGDMAEDDDKVEAQVEDAIKRLEDRRHILWSCVNIEHAEKVADKLRDLHNQTAIAYHSKTEGRAAILEAIRDNKYRNVTFVSAVAEGFDWMEADALVMMRPTRSPGLAIQMIGRVLRPADNKTTAQILDYGQVLKNIGPIDKPVIRDSTKRDKRQDMLVAAQLKTCPSCLSFLPSATSVCPDCDHEFLIDSLKNVDRKPDMEAKLFSSDSSSRIKWMNVGDVEAQIKTSYSGNKTVEIRVKKTLFDGPFAGIKDFIVLESWNRMKAETKIAAYAGSCFKWGFETPETIVRAVNNSDVSEVLVDETGKWPKVLRVRKADGREFFVA